MNFKQVILMRTDLQMSKGKIAAQTGHAVIEAFLKTQKQSPENVQEWLSSGAEKVVLKISSEKELLEFFEKLKKLFPCALIKDAGHTQVESGTPTCIGIGPVKESEINKFTSKLKLL